MLESSRNPHPTRQQQTESPQRTSSLFWQIRRSWLVSTRILRRTKANTESWYAGFGWDSCDAGGWYNILKGQLNDIKVLQTIGLQVVCHLELCNITFAPAQ
jgi:hypothetical protein